MGYNLDVPEFNMPGSISQDGVNGSCVMTNPDWRYTEFTLERHLDTIKADVRLLYWARKQMQQ